MLAYSGDQLEKYVTDLKITAMAQTGLDRVYERNFVDNIRKYCFSGKVKKVFIICGFRATGKTFGLLQAIEDFEDTIYIQAQRGESLKGEDYIRLLQEVNVKNIIIDEYTWIEDNQNLSGYLWTVVENGRNVVITGTHSIALDYLEDGPLIHRGFRINVNLFTYEEFCRIYQKPYCKTSCVNFLRTGGIFRDHALKNYVNLNHYMQDAIIDDLARFINLPVAEAKVIVYDII